MATLAGSAAAVGSFAYNFVNSRRQEAREIAREDREARIRPVTAFLDTVLRHADSYDPGFGKPVQLSLNGDDTPLDLGVSDDWREDFRVDEEGF